MGGGAAVGCRIGLENSLFRYGKSTAKCPCIMIFVLIVVEFAVMGMWVSSGKGIPMETRVSKLWVESGGRLEEELDYVDSHKVPGWDQSVNLALFVPLDDTKDILSQQALDDQLAVMKMALALKVNVTVKGVVHQFSLSGLLNNEPSKFGLCDYVPFPDEIVPSFYRSIVDKVVPCNRVTILDCFLEGEIDFYLKPLIGALHGLNHDLIVKEYGLYGYSNRLPAWGPLSSYVGNTPEQNLDIVKSGCKGYISKIMTWDKTMLFGGYEVDEAGDVTSIQAFQYILRMGSPNQLAKKFIDEGISASAISEMQQEWAYMFEQEVVAMNEAGKFSATRVEVLSDGAFDRVVASFSDANTSLILLGYGLMAIFVVISQVSRTKEKNTVFVGLSGLVLVFLGNIVALALLVLGGVKLNATVLQVLPFLALGLGVDDMFVLMSVYKEELNNHPNFGTLNLIGSVVRQGGVSVSLTSTCNAAAFGIGILIPLPAVQVFCIASTVAVLVNYVTLMVAVPSLLAVYHRMLTGKVTPADNPQKAEGDSHGNSYTKVNSGFLHKVYIPFLQKKGVRVGGVILFLIITAVCAFFSTQVDNGLDILDVVPDDVPLYRSMDIVMSKFHIMPASVVTTELDYGDPAVQKALYSMMRNMSDELPFVINADPGWIEKMINFYNGTEHSNAEGWITANASKFSELYVRFTDSTKASYLDAYMTGMMSFGISETTGSVNYARMGFTIIGMKDTQMFVDALEKTRAYLDKHCGPDKVIKRCFPSGTVFTFWEQYVTLKSNFFKAVGLCGLAILGCCVILILSVVIGLFVSLMSFAVIIQIYGLLYFAAIKFSAIPAVSLIMSIGIAVEFTAHLCTHFESAHGTRVERMAESLHHMFVPILEGGFSSFLGFGCLAVSPFTFIVKYYFLIYFLVVIIGLLNGLFFLPLILSFVGPTPHAKTEAIRELRRKSLQQ